MTCFKSRASLHIVALAGSVALATACSTLSKPCAQGGDVTWTPPLRTNKRCMQKKLPDGKYVNHGEYREFSEKGTLVLEGQFDYGQKNGLWTQYDEKGRKLAEKRFENGQEILPAQAPASTSPGRDPRASSPPRR